MIDGKGWYPLIDLRNILDMTQGGNNIAHLDRDEFMTMRKSNLLTEHRSLLGTGSRITLLTKSGLFKLISRSNRPLFCRSREIDESNIRQS